MFHHGWDQLTGCNTGESDSELADCSTYARELIVEYGAFGW